MAHPYVEPHGNRLDCGANRIRHTAKSGGEAFLLNRDTCCEIADIVREIAVVELANCSISITISHNAFGVAF